MMNRSKLTQAVAIFGFVVSGGSAFAASHMAGHHGHDVMQNHHGMQKDGPHGSMHGNRVSGGRLSRLLEVYDTNADRELTQEEILGAREARLNEFDSDQDGKLDINEYELLWLDAMRERMVDRFQQHDDDGDGRVTVGEFNEEFQRLIERYDRNSDGILNKEDSGQ